MKNVYRILALALLLVLASLTPGHAYPVITTCYVMCADGNQYSFQTYGMCCGVPYQCPTGETAYPIWYESEYQESTICSW